MHRLVDFVHSVLFYTSFHCSCVSLMSFLLILKNTAKRKPRKPAATEVDSLTPLLLCTFKTRCRLCCPGERVGSSKIWCAVELLANPVPTDGPRCGVTSTIDVCFFLPCFKRICPPDKFKRCQNWHLSQELTGGKALKCQIPSKFSQLFIISLVVDTYPRKKN